MKRNCLISIIATMSIILAGCATGQARGWVDTSAWAANYTEDYIYDFWVHTTDGQDTGVGGVQVAEFSKGGKSGHICCSPMPGVGQVIKVIWRVGGRQDDESKWRTYSRDLVVTGATSNDSDTMNFLIVRFFPDHDVEAEFVSESAKPDGKANSRVDQLFYGRRVMRHKGE